MKTLKHVWDWNNLSTSEYRTADNGGIGPDGELVVQFTVPTGVQGMGSVMIAPYPGDLSGCDREVSLSQNAADFSAPFPSTRTGYDVGMQFDVGSPVSPRSNPLLAPGVWFCRIRSPGCASAGRACDFVVKFSQPMGQVAP